MRQVFCVIHGNVKTGLHASGNIFKKVRDRKCSMKTKDLPKFKAGNLVLLRNHEKHNRDAKYMPNL